MAQLVAEGLAKDPGARPTIDHFARELHAIASGARTSGALVAPRRTSRGRRLVLLAAATAAVVAAAGATRDWIEREPAPAASASPGASATTSSAPAPSFRAEADGGLLTIANVGDHGVAGLRVVVYDEEDRAHEATDVGELAPGQEVTLALDAFTPALSASARPRRVSIQPAGRAQQDVPLR
jgi:hypothetical protein